MKVPYIMKRHVNMYVPCYRYTYRHLNPTGRWKLESGPRFDNMLLIEHKGLIFKRWVCEDEIVFRSERKSVINQCNCKE